MAVSLNSSSSSFSPAVPIGRWRPNLSPGESKEGKVMAPVYTVVLCVPAVLALLIAVYGLAVVCPRQREAGLTGERQTTSSIPLIGYAAK
jgi:hypothetical protein